MPSTEPDFEQTTIDCCKQIIFQSGWDEDSEHSRRTLSWACLAVHGGITPCGPYPWETALRSRPASSPAHIGVAAAFAIIVSKYPYFARLWEG